MSILLGVGVATSITVIYLGKKGWHAFHRVLGISPGVLVYENPNQPIALPDMTWQTLALPIEHLQHLPKVQLTQLQRIDSKTLKYQAQQKSHQVQQHTATLTEQQFVLHKLLHTRLPQMLASYQHLYYATAQSKGTSANDPKLTEAHQLLQDALDNIEGRLDALLDHMQTQHLQDLRVMKRYMDSHQNHDKS